MVVDLSTPSICREQSLDTSKGHTVAYIPYVGFLAIRNRKKPGINFLAPQGDNIELINLFTDIGQCVRNSSKRGYAASAILGLPGEGSAAAAMSGVLCLMPCHWAAYAAAIAKFTPLATYFAGKPSCCHAEPTITGQIVSYGLDTAFYGTLALLALGAGRRILRKEKTNAILNALDECADDIVQGATSNLSIVEEPGYQLIHDAARAEGLEELLAERAKRNYERPASSILGKALQPIKSGIRRAGRMIADPQYCENGKAICHAYRTLAMITDKLAQEREETTRRVLEIIAQGYQRESHSYLNSFNPKNLGVKLAGYVKGFTENNNWYRT
jgi:hypothetical protein